MEASVQRVADWKKANIAFEPTRSYLILTRFQQYLDILMKDLGLSPYRKFPNIFGEVFSRYGADDYRTVQSEYQQNLKYRDTPLRPCDYDT
jgi:dimethylaniline monooxygenase (N-oxide forming)